MGDIKGTGHYATSLDGFIMRKFSDAISYTSNYRWNYCKQIKLPDVTVRKKTSFFTYYHLQNLSFLSLLNRFVGKLCRSGVRALQAIRSSKPHRGNICGIWQVMAVRGYAGSYCNLQAFSTISEHNIALQRS